MRVGLIDVDGHNFPNLALMKISAWHKAQGDTVEWWWGFGYYDRVYMSKVFDNTYTPDSEVPLNADEIFKGGTGYFRHNKENSEIRHEVFHNGKWCDIGDQISVTYDNETYTATLPLDVEHSCPDYSLYPQLTKNTALGFLTRGCPRNCPVCIVSAKEGRCSFKVADLAEWWTGQRHITLMDPNLLAFKDHADLLQQLADSKAWVEFNQGLDARCLTDDNIAIINKIRLKQIHFAWDYMKDEKPVLAGLGRYKEQAIRKPNGAFGTVYTLTNYDTTMEENLHRIYTLRGMGYDPYVMIYDKPNAPREVRRLQRWCNNRAIFKSCPDFKDYTG